MWLVVSILFAIRLLWRGMGGSKSFHNSPKEEAMRWHERDPSTKISTAIRQSLSHGVIQHGDKPLAQIKLLQTSNITAPDLREVLWAID